MGCQAPVAKKFLATFEKKALFTGLARFVAKSGKKFLATWHVLKPVLATTFRWNFNDL